MIDVLLIISLALFAVALSILAHEISVVKPGLCQDDPSDGRHWSSLASLRRSLDESAEGLNRRSAHADLKAEAAKMANRRYRRYPSAFVRHCLVASLFFAGSMGAFAIANFLDDGFALIRALWVVASIMCLAIAIALLVLCLTGNFLPAPMRFHEGKAYTKESMYRVNGECWMPLGSVDPIVERFGRYALLDARPYNMVMGYPLPSGIRFQQSDERGWDVERNQVLKPWDIEQLVPDHDTPIFVVSDYGKESHLITCDLRDYGFRHAYDLGGIAHCYGAVAKVFFVLDIIYNRDSATEMEAVD